MRVVDILPLVGCHVAKLIVGLHEGTQSVAGADGRRRGSERGRRHHRTVVLGRVLLQPTQQGEKCELHDDQTGHGPADLQPGLGAPFRLTTPGPPHHQRTGHHG